MSAECNLPDAFLCNTGECLVTNLLCDGTPHCASGEDEMNCGKSYDDLMILNNVR